MYEPPSSPDLLLVSTHDETDVFLRLCEFEVLRLLLFFPGGLSSEFREECLRAGLARGVLKLPAPALVARDRAAAICVLTRGALRALRRVARVRCEARCARRTGAILRRARF